MRASEPLSESFDHAVDIRGVTKRFGRSVVAVDNLSLRIPRGATLGLLGPNGAGKSTTIRMLVGLTQCDEGEIQLLGVDANQQRDVELMRRIGYVPELHQLYRWMRVDQLIAFVAKLYPNWDASLCEELLTMFALPPRRKIKQLSKGMAAKLGLLVALCPRPELLILDEPTSGLDPLVRDEFLDGILKTQSSRGRSILFSSHHVNDVQRLADRVGIMHEGQLVLCDDVDQLCAQTKQFRCTLQDGRLPSWTPETMIWQSIDRREWSLTVYPFEESLPQQLRESNPIEHLEIDDVSLEDIFKQTIRGRREHTRSLESESPQSDWAGDGGRDVPRIAG